MALERWGHLRLLDVSTMLPTRGHFEEDYGHWLRSSQRQGEDTIRRCWSPTEQDVRNVPASLYSGQLRGWSGVSSG